MKRLLLLALTFSLRAFANPDPAWTTWNDLGGQFNSSPAVACMNEERVDVFIRAPGALYHRIALNGVWQASSTSSRGAWTISSS